LYLYNTIGVSLNGVKILQKSLPNCDIVW
jgi:hypothetical protein